MKISKLAAAVFAVVGTVLLVGSIAASFVGLSSSTKAVKPSEEANDAAQAVLNALDSGDFVGVAAYFYGTPSLGLDREPATAAGKQLWQAYRDSVSVTSGTGCYSEGSEIYRTAEITAMDISSVTSQLGRRAAELLGKKRAEAEEPSQLLDEDGQFPQSMKEEALTQALQDLLAENPKTVTRQVTLKLVQQDGQWLAVPDKALLEILSGGLD